MKRNRGAAGVDCQSIAMFARHWVRLLTELHKALMEGTYRPLPVLRAWIDKPGSTDKRPLGIPAVRDRVVQTALRCVLEPIFEHGFSQHSYGFRPGRSALQAVVEVDHLESRMRENRQSGLEGGGAGDRPPPTPIGSFGLN